LFTKTASKLLYRGAISLAAEEELSEPALLF